jgi:chitinase
MKNQLVTLLILFSTIALHGQTFRTVGYLPSYRWGAINSIDFDQLDYVCYSFANPDANGNFSYSQDITALKAKAVAANCKVFASIGGGAVSMATETAYKNLTVSSELPAFIHQLMNYLRAAGVDGVDVDLEHSLVTMSTYNDFVIQLSDSVHAAGLGISAAMAKYTSTTVTVAAIDALDFINVMSYDQTGSWAPSQPGPHSTYVAAVADFDYWKNTKNQSADKIVLGVPFYGYEFKNDGSAVSAWTWCDIVSTYPNNVDDDQVTTAAGTVYHNGKATIAQKTQFALDQGGGGIMIWELGQDCFDDNSLLNVINTTKQATLGVNETTARAVMVFPNPVHDVLSVIGTELSGVYKITDIMGSVVAAGIQLSRIDVSSLEQGVYILSVVNRGHGTTATRFVKN